ncbi:MAG: GNAT family N-acetyltransferase [Vicinamibacterales bacterium]
MAATQAPAVIDAFCDAFRDYPVMRHVIGPADPDDAERLRALIELFVMTRVRRDDPMLAIADDDRLLGAATFTVPGPVEPLPETAAHKQRVFARLGDDARERYEAFAASGSTFFAALGPHYHLNMLGVRRAVAGRGLGRRLLDAAAGLSRAHQASTGVSLTTENPRNVPLYEHIGFRVVGHARVAPTLESWGLFLETG